MLTLILAEKPELGRAIAKAIDGENKEIKGVIRKKNVIIAWAYGHLLRLCEPDEYDAKYKQWRKEDLPIYFNDWKLVPDGKKKERVDQLLELIEECDQIIHAGDPDDEGQFLIDEIIDYSHTQKPVKRVYINDNTPANIKKAFHDLKDNDQTLRNIGKSAYARAVADYIVGINYSRLYSLLLHRTGLSVGRVQSPTLGLIVTRDEQIDQHIKQKYYELEVQGNVENQQLTLKLKPKSEYMEDGKHMMDLPMMEQIKEELCTSEKRKLKVEEKEQFIKPPLPFNLAKLQAHMNTKYGFDLSKTDQITQTLRDRYQAITYNRSDSQYLKEEHFKEAPTVLKHVMNKLQEQYPVDYSIHSDCFHDAYVSAHHAIIPTMSDFNIQALSEDERKVYEEISRFYIMQFLPPVQKKQKSAVVKTKHGELKQTYTTIIDEGYRAYFKDKSEDEEKENETKFSLPVGTYDIDLREGTIIEKETNPPKRYTQASLIRDMTSIAKYVKDKEIREILKKKDKYKKGENGSIGTSATRSQIVETLIKRKFIEIKGRTIVSTPLGKEFYHMLPQEMKYPDMTAKWWVIQEDIKEGKASVDTLVESVVETFRPHLQMSAKDLKLSEQMILHDNRKSLGTCPICHNKIVAHAKGFGCANYRNGCRFAIWNNDPFLVSIDKKPSEAMVEKLLKDGYCKVKIKEGDQEVIRILQLGTYQNKAAFRLLDPKQIKK